jgi:CRISPR-associated endonuclease/helicase Cas3
VAYYAHTKGNEPADWQLLKEHLLNTAALARQFGEDAGVGELAYAAGLLHDLGKYSGAFQKRLAGSRKHVDHSTAGSKEIRQLFKEMPKGYLAELISYCIAGHHGGMPDNGSAVDLGQTGTLQARLNSPVEEYQAYKTELSDEPFDLPSRLALRPLPGQPGFSAAFLTRMVFSALVDADFIDAERFIKGDLRRGEFQTIESLCNTLNAYLTQFDQPTNEINRKRTATLKACISRANEPKGFFTLTIPTGGGKTLASLAFALNHAVKHGMRRVIYVVPFTTIIEQNAGEFKKILGKENVLEHHANFDWKLTQIEGEDGDESEDNEKLRKLRLATETWDAPIIVTTNVQFFESFFSNKPSSCRKLHNVANSVIIFDEAQMLPRDTLYPAMDATWELVNNYKCSVVFCTATQPALSTFLPVGTKVSEQAEDLEELYRFYKRVHIRQAGKISDAELISQIRERKQCLCIVNTRKHAQSLVKMLEDENCLHLSTTMCPAHRQQVVKTMRERLKSGEDCRVISTQVMEAGIDVDFPTGYRALAGLDSIIQAAGRVNREGKTENAELTVFEPQSSYVTRTPMFIEQGAAVSRTILQAHPDDPVSQAAIEDYYKLLYSLQDGERTFDAKEILRCFNKIEGFDFATAAGRFKIIDKATRPVVIPFDDTAARLIDAMDHPDTQKSSINQLQTYTINLFEEEYLALERKGGIKTIGEIYAVLAKPELYRMDVGIEVLDLSSGNAIHF